MVALTDVLSWIDLLNLAGASSGPLGALAAVWGRAPSSTDAAEPLPSQVPTGLLNYVNGAVLVIDSTYRVEHFNQQVHPFFPDQQIEVGAVLPRALADDLPESGKTVTVVWPLASDITVQMHVQAVRGPGGILRVLTLRDVSEAVQYEAALRKTDRLLRSILDTDVAAIAVVNG